MKHLLLLTLLVLVTSGCTSETGRVTDVPNPHDDYDEYVGSKTNPCDGIECDITTITCPDGFQVSCRDTCDPGTGNCLSCEPLCTGHQAPPTETQTPQTTQEPTTQADPRDDECTLTCGDCQTLSNCSCITTLSCDGNDICEQGEYPDSDDCEPCPEDDQCTSYIFDFSVQRCIPEDICCGNNICDNDETDIICPHDCFQEDGDITILRVNETDEYVEIEGYGFLLTGWSLKDNASKTYSFPDGFEIEGIIKVHTGIGDDTLTDLYWGRSDYVWNNNGDIAYLLDDQQEIVDKYTYP